jgi:hypothetical protein
MNSDITSISSNAVYSGGTGFYLENCTITASNGIACNRVAPRNCTIIANVGVSTTTGNIINNTINSSSHGIESSSGNLISNNTIIAGGRGIDAGNLSVITGNTITAVDEAVYLRVGDVAYSNPLLKSTGNIAVNGSQFGDVLNNIIITTSNNAAHHGIKYGNYNPSYDSVARGNYIEVANASANAINSTGPTTIVYSVNNTFKGMTTPLSIATENAQTNTTDAYGNLIIG